MTTIQYIRDYTTLSSMTADIIENTMKTTPDHTNLGLPTGNTPMGLYQQLRKKNLNWSNTRTFNLDEYIDITPDNPASFNYYMQEQLHMHTDIPKKNIFFPTLIPHYDTTIHNYGGLNLIILGLGHNGHIAFNEPGSTIDSTTRIIDLSIQTREDNGKQYPCPKQAITMGIATILNTEHAILLAQGLRKLQILKQALWHTITPNIPASYLQLHKNLQVLYCD